MLILKQCFETIISGLHLLIMLVPVSVNDLRVDKVIGKVICFCFFFLMTSKITLSCPFAYSRMASNLVAMASNLASNLVAMASNLVTIASNLVAPSRRTNGL